MPMRNDPRIRQTLNQISQNIETANTNTQTALFSFTEYYLKPCFASISSCATQCTATCCPSQYDERSRRRGGGVGGGAGGGGRRRGRAEFSFDFYDDWDDDIAANDGGLLGWGNDELDRLLAGSGSASRQQVAAVPGQPERKRPMTYGTLNRPARRRATLQGRDADDPTVVPSSSVFGFLERLPFKIGSRALRYKPSAADLQENVGQSRLSLEEGEPLIEDSEDEVAQSTTKRRKGRLRSGTTASEATTESFRSRGDLFPSEDEDDAVPLDDEFAMALERRTTGSGAEGSLKSGKRPSRSRTVSSKSLSSKSPDSDAPKPSFTTRAEEIEHETDQPEVSVVPSMKDLKEEEERVKREEEQELDRRREAARRLAEEMGLVTDQEQNLPGSRGIDPSIPSQFPDA